jgi:hypothetical protein
MIRKFVLIVFPMLLLLSGGCRFFRHKVTCSPVWTAPTTFGNPITVSGIISLSFSPNCTGGAFANARFYIGCPDSIDPSCEGKPWPSSNPINPNSPYYVHFDEGAVSSFQFNTTTIPNGKYDFGLNLLDAKGNVIGAVRPVGQPDRDQVLTVANDVSTPTPTPGGP